MSTSHPGQLVSRRAALAGLGVGGLGLTLATRRSAVSAQDATPESLAGHPLVGTWLAITAFGASPETFAADGSVVAGPPSIEPGERGVTYFGPAIGVWESTGPRSGRFTFVQALADATGVYAGTLTIDGHLDVSADGQSFVDDSPETTLTFRDAANAVLRVITPYQAGDGSVPPVTGIRMGVGAPGFPAGTPDTATPAS
jgi:hypothetical protein